MLPDNVSDIDIQTSLEGSYLDYSMSVIVGRALPDARDGLKPVHRRILYAMNKLNITSKTPYKKSARIVGDTMGKYHPHGDNSIYDALVRMAQDFSMRIPLIDGQGNFGSLDGDAAAAMRYTEARMTKFSEDMLQDIDKDTVNFVPTYDDSDTEPSILPTILPNLLVNGSEGIAVGMATKIPPHNLAEIVDALLHLLDNSNASVEDLLSIVKGPDFPTGGTIFGTAGIRDAYTKGRGKVKIRAKHHLETRNKKEVIVIDELPYQINKSKLIEQIASLVREKTIEGISDIRDESDKEGVRIVIEIKKEAMSEIVLNNLYKTTNLQTTFGIILLAVNNKEPHVFNLLELLDVFLKHRKTVIIRRTLFDLDKAKAREHILQGLKIAIDNIDEVVKIIRQSSNDTEAKQKLGSTFALSAIQAGAILDMRLGRLTGLQIEKLDAELKELAITIKRLEGILKSEDKLSDVIRGELEGVKQKYDTKRRTDIEESYDDIEMEDLIPNEPMVVTITHNGYVKRVSSKSYERQKRGGKGKIAVTAHDDDFISRFFISNTHDTLLFVTNLGQLYWLKVYKIPEAGRTAKGKAVVNLIGLKENEKIMSIIPTTDFDSSKSLTFFTKNGIAKRTSLDNFSNIRTNGVKAIVLNEGDEVVTSAITDADSKYLMVFTSLGQVIKFEVSKIKNQGRGTKGVRAIKFKKPKDKVVDGDIIKSDEQEVLTVASNGIAKRSSVDEYRLTNRGGSGVISMKLEGNSCVIGNVVVDENNDLMALTSAGKMIRIHNEAIRKTGRSTKGVTLVNIDSKDKVVSIASCPKEEDKPQAEDGDIDGI